MSETATLDEWLTDDLITQYTTGDCWLLAWQLHLLKGCDIFVLAGYDDENDDPMEDWSHVVVSTGNDEFLDIEGFATSAELERHWGGNLVPVEMNKATSFKAYRHLLGMLDADSLWGDEGRNSEEVACELLDVVGLSDVLLAA